MGSVGRNDPCPCGSGKKYKQCCLKREREAEMRLQAQASARAEDETAAHEAAAWLRGYSPLMAASLSEAFFGPGLDAGAKLAKLPRGFALECLRLFDEWALSQLRVQLKDRTAQACELVLGEGGPRLSRTGRDYVQALAGTELSLYDVLETGADRMRVQSLLDPEDEPFWAHVDLVHAPFAAGNVAGLRIIQRQGRTEVARGALAFARGTGLQVLDAVRQEIAKAAELDAEGRRRLAERLVVRIWMGMLQGGQSG